MGSKACLKRTMIALTLGSTLVLTGCSGGDPNDEADTAPAPEQTAPTPTESESSPVTPEPSESASESKPESAPVTPSQDPDSVQVLVNKQNPLQPVSYAPTDLTDIGHGHYLRAEAASSYRSLVQAAATDGHSVVPTSSYRSYNSQVETHNHWKQQYGQAYAEQISARPGYSEHQTGLAVDVMPASGECRLEQCFGQLPSGQWVASNAHKYGFIIRYPSGQEGITGYSYEPWHLRYVGTDVAAQIFNSGKTMEEFFGFGSAPSY